MSRATVSGLHVGSNLVFCTCSLSIDPTSHITGVTVSHELFRMNPSEPFAPSYRGTVSLIYPVSLSVVFCYMYYKVNLIILTAATCYCYHMTALCS